jgi:hypothetical protein
VRDHTSILSTVLHRFAPDAASAMGPRVARALDVSAALSAPAPRADIPPIRDIAPPPVVAMPKRAPNSFGDALRHTIFPF